jgi:hypothetical protein
VLALMRIYLWTLIASKAYRLVAVNSHIKCNLRTSLVSRFLAIRAIAF